MAISFQLSNLEHMLLHKVYIKVAIAKNKVVYVNILKSKDPNNLKL